MKKKYCPECDEYLSTAERERGICDLCRDAIVSYCVYCGNVTDDKSEHMCEECKDEDQIVCEICGEVVPESYIEGCTTGYPNYKELDVCMDCVPEPSA